MKKTFLKFLPVAAAVLLATSCSKDDNGSTVVDNIATPDPVQEVVKPEAKNIITITGKVNQNLSKVTTDEDLNLLFAGGEEFYIIDNEKNKCGTLTIQSDKSTYVAKIDAENIDKGPFEARLGENPDVSDWSTVTAYQTLQEALDAAYYIIPFKVTKSGDTYSIGDVTASIQCAFVKALSSKDIEVGHVTAGNYYIVPEGLKISDKVDYTKNGRIYKVGGKDLLSTAKFSVSSSTTVFFSKGNLMYRPGFGYFFADKQWDYIGNAEGNISETEGTRDLFGWASWHEGYEPMNSSEDDGDYTWGYAIKTAIGSEWSTLSNAQWTYLIEERAGNRYAKAKVAGKNGIILLPDGWNTETYPALTNYNTPDVSFSASNAIDEADWATLEAAGAVFLPAAGYRSGTVVSYADYGNYGGYWSSSYFNGDKAYILFFSTTGVKTDGYKRSYGHSVRLVHLNDKD